MNRLNLRMVLPIQVGLMALLIGGYFLVVTARGSESQPRAKPEPSATVKTVPLVVNKGGFRIGVPAGVTPKKIGNTVRLSSVGKELVVTAGPVAGGTLTSSSKAFIRSMKKNYTAVRVLGTDQQTVDGRPALATYGQAVNAKKVRVRFVNVVVRAKPYNFAINSFASFVSDPKVILPKVNAIVSSFSVLS